jgi:glycosyltransferase involved in cell wall biosynthesis
MRILEICNKSPFPPRDGGAIGMNNVILGLIDAGIEIDVIAVNTPKHFIKRNEIPKWYLDKTKIQFAYIDTDVKIIPAFLNLFSNESYNITRFINPSLEELIKNKLLENEYDFIQLESIYLAPYTSIIRKYSNAKLILRAPNIEHIIWKRLANEESNFLRKSYLKILANRIKKYEDNCIHDFDAIYTVSEEDLNYFKKMGFNKSLKSIPTGIDYTKNLAFNLNNTKYPSIFHLGALDWFPNQEGLKWFLDEVWPIINKEFPSCEFHIAGRKPPKWISEINQPNVIVHGEVEDAADFIKKYAIMIVPLFSGSGMRVKIIEGMMLGRAIVSSQVGAESLNVKDGYDILIYNDKNSFINKLSLLLNDKRKFIEMSNSALNSATKNYSNEILTKKLIEFLKTIN